MESYKGDISLPLRNWATRTSRSIHIVITIFCNFFFLDTSKFRVNVQTWRTVNNNNLLFDWFLYDSKMSIYSSHYRNYIPITNTIHYESCVHTSGKKASSSINIKMPLLSGPPKSYRMSWCMKNFSFCYRCVLMYLKNCRSIFFHKTTISYRSRAKWYFPFTVKGIFLLC